MSHPGGRHDIVVVGGSSGGVTALVELLSRLPADLPAAVFVVVHLGARPSRLAEVLHRAAPLPVDWARDGDPILPGRVRLAPPDHHLLLVPSGVALGRGPREHRARPAIDVLFRSAARAYGSRVVGVILSGSLQDGAAGALAVHERGGTVLVQDPAEAASPSMPDAAIAVDDPALVAPVADLAKRLCELAGTSSSMAPAESGPEEEIALMTGPPAEPLSDEASPFSCPECGGVLWDVAGPLLRCRVGHAYDPEDLLVEAAVTAEGALWTAIRSLTEQAERADRLAERADGRGHPASATRQAERAEDARGAAEQLRNLLRDGMTALRGLEDETAEAP